MNAVVTGATKGIGKAIACMLAEMGFNLAINARNADELSALKQELEHKYNVKVLAAQCDVSEREHVERFAEAVLAHFNTIDVLVNNAGVFLPGNIADEESGKLEYLLETNLFSAYDLTRKMIPKMISQKKGYIFNVCSVASIQAYSKGGSYSISKFALLGFSKALREDLRDKNIAVTALIPGATFTNSWAGTDLPESRFMKAEDIAEMVKACLKISPNAVVEEIVMRPMLGDI